MKKRIFCLFLSVFLILCLPGMQTGQNEKTTASDVVAKYLEAIGGVEALKKINTQTIKYRVHMFSRDGYIMERTWKRPDTMRTGPSGAPFYTLTEGEKSWRVTPDGRQAMPAAVAANFAKLADIDGPFVDTAKKGISLEYLGTEKYDMTALNRLKITFKDGVEWEYFFDFRTGLLRKMKQPTFIMLNNKISQGPDAWFFYFDYRAVGDVKFAHLWLQVTDDHTHAFVVEDMVINNK